MSISEKSTIHRNQMAFLNETQYIGRIKSFSLELSRKMIIVGGLGGVGDMEIPTGKYEASTASVEFESIALADVRTFTSNDGFVQFRFAADIRMVDAKTGTRIIDAAITRVFGYIKNPPVPGYSEESAPYTAQLAVTFVEISNTSGRIFMLDLVEGIVERQQSSGNFGLTVTI